jgi:hypothetical protein
MTHAKAVALMIVAAPMWNTGGVVSRHLQSARGLEITFWRSAFAASTVLVPQLTEVDKLHAHGKAWLAGGRLETA